MDSDELDWWFGRVGWGVWELKKVLLTLIWHINTTMTLMNTRLDSKQSLRFLDDVGKFLCLFLKKSWSTALICNSDGLVISCLFLFYFYVFIINYYIFGSSLSHFPRSRRISIYGSKD